MNFARNPAVRRRIVFIENYDINIARYLVQGVDVWLNTPRRGMRGQRHQRNEGGGQRRASIVRSSMDGGSRDTTRIWAGPSAAARAIPTRTRRTRSKARPSTTSWKSRLFRCSTSAPWTTFRATGSCG